LHFITLPPGINPFAVSNYNNNNNNKLEARAVGFTAGSKEVPGRKGL
jgi:hypothetical protein